MAGEAPPLSPPLGSPMARAAPMAPPTRGPPFLSGRPRPLTKEGSTASGIRRKRLFGFLGLSEATQLLHLGRRARPFWDAFLDARSHSITQSHSQLCRDDINATFSQAAQTCRLSPLGISLSSHHWHLSSHDLPESPRVTVENCTEEERASTRRPFSQRAILVTPSSLLPLPTRACFHGGKLLAGAWQFS